jgi:hypothetical protein
MKLSAAYIKKQQEWLEEGKQEGIDLEGAAGGDRGSS